MMMKRAWLLAVLTTVAGCGEFDSQHSTLMLEVQSPEVAGLSRVSVEPAAASTWTRTSPLRGTGVRTSASSRTPGAPGRP